MPVREIISSYGSPIVMGLTPYTRVALKLPEQRQNWPPFVDAERLDQYAIYTALVENRPHDVFDDLMLRSDQREKIVIAAALPELLCNVWADSVWSDPPTIEMRTTTLSDRWKAIDTANDFSESLAWESTFAAAAWGTSVLKLRRDESRKAEFDTDVVIEEIDPATYFPILKRGSAREVEAIVLAWEEDRAQIDAERSDWWQVREIHELQDGQYVATRQERPRQSITGRAEFVTVSTEAPDGVDFLPFVDMHAKRWRGRYWGVSELSRVETIVDEIDNTLSNVAEILEYHGKPMLQVPASVIFGGTLTKGADKTMGIRRPEEAGIARYITYDGQISAQMEDLDRLLELAFLTSEVPRTYFGLGLEGGSPSGTSLKLQLQNYLKKAGRWQAKETLRLRTLVPMALKLDSSTDTKTAALMPEITHGSPLPADDQQEATIETGLYTSGLSSRELSITRLRRVPKNETVEDEIARIEDEKAASVAALPAPLRQNASQGSQNGSGQPPNSSTDPNAGDGAPA